jgi:hypothetical protein
MKHEAPSEVRSEAPTVGDTNAPARNFKLSVEERLRAYIQGVPSHIRRRRRIEDLEARLLGRLVEAPSLAEEAASSAVAGELAQLNDLIERHNRYYPIEANLPLDLRTGRLVERGAPWRPLPRLDVATLLGRATTSASEAARAAASAAGASPATRASVATRPAVEAPATTRPPRRRP